METKRQTKQLMFMLTKHTTSHYYTTMKLYYITLPPTKLRYHIQLYYARSPRTGDHGPKSPQQQQRSVQLRRLPRTLRPEINSIKY